jgi:hypothetical protein
MNSSPISTSANNEIDRLFRGRNRELAVSLIGICDELRDWWPMTVRQVYYQAVAQQFIGNCLAEYRRVSAILADLRRNDLLPWYAIRDNTRTTYGKRGVSNVAEWLNDKLEYLFDPDGYGRCYIQDQAVYVEVLIEKDALSSIASDAVYPYCTRLNVTRGHPSASMVNDIAGRLDSAMMKGKEPLLLHFGDLDPSGVAIPRSLQKALLDHHGLSVEVRRVALTPEQVARHELPSSLDAAKKQDPNYNAWAHEYGILKPVELDALHPEKLSDLIAETLKGVYDMSEFSEQIAIEEAERLTIKQVRNKTHDFLRQTFPALFGGEVRP